MEEKLTREEGMGQVGMIRVDEQEVKDHLGEMVRSSVEATLNAMMDSEAEHLWGGAA